ncbi:NAD-dependent epimerase/dehydratase family protein [Protaetiibacter intestinalis]|uniref:NAD-dependent epimerase/dehydratase family protein n=1 Tax=Protaetiibacter intestinalis TaxID=2419774 RepID=A0A387B166_9MICO|nr:NAD-dependent epimerase/dehydratase family protein [Protaetiibacter intestinalis]AYF97254.1 NAD-dependent epimerase/dehydratase family protein [Protaetiibacter intestinalis]
MRALVTGGNGFVGSHVVAALLEAGHEVVATVREPDDPARTAALRALGDAHPGRLTVRHGELLVEGSFDEAMDGCDTVLHVASPFLMAEQISDPQTQLIEPALTGTRNVLGSATRTASVTRVVLTSTIGAMFGDYSDVLEIPDRVLREEHWNSTSTLEREPYHYSKTLAEREAWRLHAEQDRWSLVTVNPGLVLGPALAAGSVSGSLFLFDELIGGTLWFGVPDIAFAPVDVREVALAHVRAAERREVGGRVIVSRDTMVAFIDFARMVRAQQPRLPRVARTVLPTWLLRMVGPAFGLDRAFIENHVGIRFALDNTRSIAELGIAYRPVEETMRDHVAAWRQLHGR